MAIGVSPEKLEFNLKQSETASRDIFIQNLDQNQAKIKVSAANFQNWVKLNPAESILLPQETKTLEVTVKSSKSFLTDLEILSYPAESSALQVASGIRLPLQVEVTQSFVWPLVFALIVSVVVVRYVFKKMKSR